MLPERVEVLKLGGTSVGTVERFHQSCQAIETYREKGKGLVVVVSAMSGVTNGLIKAARAAELGRLDEAFQIVDGIENQHDEVMNSLGTSLIASGAKEKVKEVMGKIWDLLPGVNILGNLTPPALDWIQSAGERMSPYLLGAFLEEYKIPSVVLDAAQIIATDDAFGDANPDHGVTALGVKEHVLAELEQGQVVVVGGFYGREKREHITTFGRGGSDLSATTLGRALHDLGINVLGVDLLKADVAGVMTADPRIVPNAFILPHLSRDEAAAATMLGTTVIHPRAINALPSHIPIFVRSTLEPEKEGTRIDSDRYDYGLSVKIITALPHLKLFSLSGPGMDRPGIAEVVFGELARSGINVRAITQPPTEGVMRIVIPPDAEIDPVIGSLRKYFEASMRVGDIANMEVEDVSAVGIVGDGVGKPDVLEKVFSTLKQESTIFNGNGNNSRSGGIIFIGPGDFQYSMIVRGDKGGERAKPILRALHQVLFERYLK